MSAQKFERAPRTALVAQLIHRAVYLVVVGHLEALPTPARVRGFVEKTVVGPMSPTATVPTKLMAAGAVE